MDRQRGNNMARALKRIQALAPETGNTAGSWRISAQLAETKVTSLFCFLIKHQVPNLPKPKIYIAL